jgi:hypothetical protein
MKQLIFLLFISLSLNSFGSKPYEIVVNVIDLRTKEPIVGLKIEFLTSVLFSCFTDNNGKAKYPRCKKAYVHIRTVEDPQVYSHGAKCFYKESDQGEEVVFKLMNYKKQAELIIQKTRQLPIDSSQIIDTSSCGSYTEASFSGGKSELLKFIQRNLNYPESALDKGIGGKCYLSFYIDPTGEVSNIKVTQEIPGCPECSEECIKVVAYFPKWNPAMCDGKPYGTFYNLPIRFNPG